MHDIAGGVGQHLHLDVAGALHGFFEEQCAVAERRLGLAAAAGEGFGHLAGLGDQPHAAPTTAGRGFEHDGIAESLGDLGRRFGRAEGAVAAGDGRHAQLGGQAPRRDLVAEQRESLGARPDEGQTLGRAGPGEGGVLGQEAIAGMHAVAAALERGGDQGRDVEIGRHRITARSADRPAMGGDPGVQTQGVGRREDADALHPQRIGGAGDPDGDLAPVGDQDPFEHVVRSPTPVPLFRWGGGLWPDRIMSVQASRRQCRIDPAVQRLTLRYGVRKAGRCGLRPAGPRPSRPRRRSPGGRRGRRGVSGSARRCRR